jgi:small nuclear ribonucleoprotein F
LNPKPFLTELLNRKVVIRLKWGIEYQGQMASFDKYMNVQLLDAEEYMDGQCKGALGEILIR